MPFQAVEALHIDNAASADEVHRHFMFATGQIHKQWRRVVDKLLVPSGLTQALWLPLLHLHRADAPMRQSYQKSSGMAMQQICPKRQNLRQNLENCYFTHLC